MIKDNYQARVFIAHLALVCDNGGGPTADGDTAWDRQSRYYNGVDAEVMILLLLVTRL